jgi:DNA (cytosine-5)-methyltransferase 1
MKDRNLAGPQKIYPSKPDVISRTIDLMSADPVAVLADLNIDPTEVALIHGSPECKQHSYAAGKRSATGIGHDLLMVVPRWAVICPHAHVTIENVPGVQDSPRYEEMWRALAATREVRGYVANAKYYLVPQKRKRDWICAGPVGRPCIAVPPPTCDLHKPNTWAWAMKNPCPIEDIDDGRCWTPTEWQQDILPAIPPEMSSIHIVDSEMRQWVDGMYPEPMFKNFIRRLKMHEPVPTVLTGVAIDGKLIHCHPFLDRPSTVREMARFQSFPDEYQFPVSICSLEQAYRGIGNAVAPPMAEAFGREVMATIKEASNEQN